MRFKKVAMGSDARSRIRTWFVLAAIDLAAVAGLGFQNSIGSRPVWSACVHLWLLGSLIPLIRDFPFRRGAVPIILSLSLLARLLMLPMAPSDDISRYVWEGRMLQIGFDPYQVAPDAEVLIPLRDATWEGINHKSYTAIYPPGCMLVFRGLAGLTTDPVHFKMAVGVADLGVVVLLLQLLRAVERRPAWALLYALNPVALASFAGEGHVDVFMVLFMLSALLAYYRGRFGWMFFWMGISIQMKYVSVLILPFLLQRRTWSRFWIFPAAVALPLAFFAPVDGLFHSLTAYSSGMHYNGSIHRLAASLLGSTPAAAFLCGAALAGWCAACRFLTPRPLDGATLVMSGLILLSPNVHFWYLTWVLPLLCFVPYPPLLVLHATVVFSFATLGHHFHVSQWREFPLMLWFEYAPVYATLAWTLWFGRAAGTLHDARPRSSIRSLSLIVPTLNDSLALGSFLEQARGLRVDEIVVCDGGSIDGSPEIAKAAGARLVTTLPGRGRQIAAGVDQAVGDAILVVHADTVILSDVPDRIQAVLNRTGRLGGAVGCQFERHPSFLRLISSLNGWRARWAGISFGDQGQFFRREAVAAAGGFPTLPLMEDVEWSLRLRQIDHPLYLGGGLVASTRRWNQMGNIRNTAIVLRLCLQYGWRRMRYGQDCPVHDMYERYYGSPGRPPVPPNGPSRS